MRRLVYLVLLVFLVQWAACSSPTKEELASLAAKGYYQHLIEGDYEHFLEGRVMADSLPNDYRSQLIDGYSQINPNCLSIGTCTFTTICETNVVIEQPGFFGINFSLILSFLHERGESS